MLQGTCSLSNLFSDSVNPFLYYRAMENIFCKAFNAKNYAKSHLYKQAGNSVVVPVITRIAENIMKSIEKCNNREVQRETAIC